MNCHAKKNEMRNILLLVLVAFTFAACKKDVQNSGLVGKWKLTEYLADPGDGSGTWQPADPSNPQYIEFKKDGTVNYSSTATNSSARYEITSDSTMTFFSDAGDSPFRYQLSGNALSLTPPCIEPCGQKYIRVTQ